MRYGNGNLADFFARPGVTVAYMVALDIKDTPVYVTTAAFDIPYGGKTYLGVGELGSVDGLSEGTDLEATGVKLTLSGVKADNISLALQSVYQGRTAIVMLVGLGADNAIVVAPALLWRGFIDTMNPVFGGTNAAIEVSCEHRLVDWARPKVRRFTNEDQQAKYPGDKGLEFIAQLQDRSIVWPTKEFFR